MKTWISKYWHLMLIGFIALIVGGGVLFYFQGSVSSFPASQPQRAQEEPDKNQYEIVTVGVQGDGFYPKNIEVKAGVPTKINFKKMTSFTCIDEVQSLKTGMDVFLDHENNYYTVKDLKPGAYEYNCGMYMYYGTITVK
ncbi:cupredoxin domain-containing protein [Paenibacillus farraposensis]|uniref:Cupredoxin domain-containing protein n=1 Tax=Paenibacillus farraposensis TaxID=2807095 RepID=A0ABW4D9E7_9BACL|nr:cupredoxin domain-containing protein [Paenibacillus farraposensis]MCC3380338.1 cupredoxin domain-containing protein [Paenibacillus farraposensis]